MRRIPTARADRPARRRGIGRWAALVTGAAVVLGGLGTALANPATSITYGTAGSASRFVGQVMDLCTAPSATAMAVWRAESPYGGIGVYVSGDSRACDQPELTADWVDTVSEQGWRLVPITVDRQAWCRTRTKSNAIARDVATARAQGRDTADEAVTAADALGLRRGSGMYLDVEHYANAPAACTASVLAYIGGWTERLHARGYLAGVYAHLYSGTADLTDAYTSTAYARPDAIWTARWDGSAALTGWEDVPDTLWATHQRAKQYRGGHHETYGGITLHIDSNAWDAPVATVARTYRIVDRPVVARWDRPTTKKDAVRVGTVAVGARVDVVCQTPGRTVGGTTVWNRLTDGSYVSDAYVNTPGTTDFTSTLPRCAWAYQVAGTSPVMRRTGPDQTTTARGMLQAGALAWVSCQKEGTAVTGRKGQTVVWNRLEPGGAWITDGWLRTPGNPGWTTTLPRCR